MQPDPRDVVGEQDAHVLGDDAHHSRQEVDRDDYERTFHGELMHIPQVYREAAIKAKIQGEDRDARDVLKSIPKFTGASYQTLEIWWQAYGPALSRAKLTSDQLRTRLPTLFDGQPLASVMEYFSTAHTVSLSGLEAFLRDSLASGWKDPE